MPIRGRRPNERPFDRGPGFAFRDREMKELSVKLLKFIPNPDIKFNVNKLTDDEIGKLNHLLSKVKTEQLTSENQRIFNILMQKVTRET